MGDYEVQQACDVDMFDTLRGAVFLLVLVLCFTERIGVFIVTAALRGLLPE